MKVVNGLKIFNGYYASVTENKKWTCFQDDKNQSSKWILTMLYKENWTYING